MRFWEVPWLEVSVAVALIGSAAVSGVRRPARAFRWGLVFAGATLACTVLAWLAREPAAAPEGAARSVQSALFGRTLFAVDALSAPLVVLVALLHFLTALATGRTIMRSFSLAWSLAALALRLLIFTCREPWPLVGLLAAETIPPLVELHNRGRSTRVCGLHMALFVVLLVLGQILVDPGALSGLGAGLLVAAVLVRCGAVPAHCWVTDWLEHASFGIALLFVTPLVGVCAAVRLVLPVAPDGALWGMGLFAAVTAVYAAGMAVVQEQTRRFFAFVFLSHASLVLVGLALHTPLGVTAALALWLAVPLSLAGFGLTLRALEARFGRLSLADFHGLYDNSPALAVCFALTGLACVGFPGTLGFVAAELLVDGAAEASPAVVLAVVAAGALNGIAVVRAYFRLFTGTRHPSTVSLTMGPRERFAVLTLAALILGGGLFPQPGISSRYRAAEDVLRVREDRGSASRLPPAGRRGSKASFTAGPAGPGG
jgi:NADH-quinone oxidoreductase subunit M